MASAYKSIVFKALNVESSSTSIRFNSISERLSKINAVYFELIYLACVQIFGKVIGEQEATLTRFDSTIVALSGQLLKVGYQLKGGDAAHLKQLKFTIGLSEIPTAVHFFSDQHYTSENVALREAILAHQPSKINAVRAFDRGVTARQTHDMLTDKKIPFVSRINIKSKHEEVLPNKLMTPIETDSLVISSDSWINLFSAKSKAKHAQRCIKGYHKQSKEELFFYY